MDSTPAANLDDRENWHGGYYELSIELGPRNDHRLDQATKATWRIAGAGDCFVRVPGEQTREPASAGLPALSKGQLIGVIRLPSGEETVCGVAAIREEESAGSDWLDLYLPLGALSRLFPDIGGFPFGPEGGEESLAWRRPIDQWLAVIADGVFAEVPFALGLIGFEASGTASAAELANGVPEERLVEYLLPVDGVLQRYQANR